jgi:hypothetical protein
MAYVQKRELQSGATAYIVKWKTPDGKHRTRGGFRTRKAANAYATRVEAGLLRGDDYDPKAAGLPSAKPPRFGSTRGVMT